MTKKSTNERSRTSTPYKDHDVSLAEVTSKNHLKRRTKAPQAWMEVVKQAIEAGLGEEAAA